MWFYDDCVWNRIVSLQSLTVYYSGTRVECWVFAGKLNDPNPFIWDCLVCAFNAGCISRQWIFLTGCTAFRNSWFGAHLLWNLSHFNVESITDIFYFRFLLIAIARSQTSQTLNGTFLWPKAIYSVWVHFHCCTLITVTMMLS